MGNRNIFTQRGFSLIEVMVTTVILSGLAFILSQMTTMFLSFDRGYQKVVAKNVLATDMRRLLSSSSIIRTAVRSKEASGLRTNPALFSCVCGLGACQSYQRPFLELKLTNNGQPILPSFYDDRGFSCDPNKQECTFQTQMTYFSECKPDFSTGSQDPLPTCVGTPAEFVAINYSVRQLKMANNEGAGIIGGWVFVNIADLDLQPGDCN